MKGTKVQEVYKTIPDFPNYKVSNFGNVTGKNGILNKNTNDRYLRVNLYNCGKAKSFNVHVLVAIAFLNHTPNKQIEVVDHINNNKHDNRVCNLQIINQRLNSCKDKGKNKSGFIGVYWSETNAKWQARARFSSGTKLCIGYFEEAKTASKAYVYVTEQLEEIKWNLSAEELKIKIRKLRKETNYFQNI